MADDNDKKRKRDSSEEFDEKTLDYISENMEDNSHSTIVNFVWANMLRVFSSLHSSFLASLNV